jgi:NAD-dependent dihydropyrimidine dehydrogenase PreA subunit
LILLGARGCDLEALEVLDRVFLEGEFRDPFYETRRRQLLLISADCTSCGETCFCTLVKGQPYPTKLFDLNLTPIEDGFVVEVGSEQGKRLVEENQELFDANQAEAKAEAKAKVRNRTLALLTEKNQAYRLKMDLVESHKRNLENRTAWRRLTKDCVECSACNFICPSCSCFLLLDSRQSRDKVWDACLKAGYARVAGGANSRPKLYERLQNRYHCKFDYSFDRLGRYTCVGCGRCIDGCAGNIDMRRIFVELEQQAPLTAKLE